MYPSFFPIEPASRRAAIQVAHALDRPSPAITPDTHTRLLALMLNFSRMLLLAPESNPDPSTPHVS